MTGEAAGSPESDYADGTVLSAAVVKAREYWEMTLAAPDRLTATANEEDHAGAEIAKRVDSESEKNA